MPLKAEFLKANIASFTRKPTGGTANVVCVASKALCKKMGWSEVPEWQKASTAQGKLVASIIEFVPDDPSFGKHAIELQSRAVRDFQFLRTQIKKGKKAASAPSFRLELHCAVDFVDAQGAAKLEEYMLTVRDGSTMRVTYEKAPEQEELLASGEQREVTSKEND